MTTIIINGEELKMKFTLRAMLIFEQVCGKTFALSNITDEYIYLYCMIMANNPDSKLTFNDLIDAMDEDPGILMQFKKLLEDYTSKQQLLNKENGDADLKKNPLV